MKSKCEFPQSKFSAHKIVVTAAVLVLCPA